jgi:membrane protein/epoxyqueuosine reductase
MLSVSDCVLHTAQMAAPATGKFQRFRRHAIPGARFLTSAEVQTFAFAVAAYGFLAFFPFIVTLLTLARDVFHSQAMYKVLLQILKEYLPASQDFVIHHLNVMVNAQSKAQFGSLLMLFISAKGVFTPLETALNRIWGFPKNRRFLEAQIIAIGLAFSCGFLGLMSVAMTAANQYLLQSMFSGGGRAGLRTMAWVVMKIFAVAASIAIFFLIYWWLPNGPTSPRKVLPAAIGAGLMWEIVKYVYFSVMLPHLKYGEVYGPFSLSVTLMSWAFVTGLVLLLGGYVSALRR